MSEMVKNALVIGASRGIGLGIVQQLVQRGWNVTGTARKPSGTLLHDYAETVSGRVTIEQIDITNDDDISAFAGRSSGKEFDLILVNAGIAVPGETVRETGRDGFMHTMMTNVYAPAAVIESLDQLVTEDGTLAVTSSRQGSLAFNTSGGHPVYRASKSAINQLMRSYAAVNPEKSVLLIHPGWVNTDFGGHSALETPLPGQISLEQSAPGIANMIENHLGEKGIQFRDWQDEVVPW